MQFLDAVLALLQEDQLFDNVIDMLLVVLSNTTIRQQKATYFPKFLFLFTDGIIGLKLNESVSQDYERLTLISHLFVEFGEAFTDSLVLSVGENLTNKFFLTMLNLSAIEGSFSLDEDVSHNSLYFWFLAEETIIELDLIGKGLHPGITEIYTRLVANLIKKSLFPTDWSSWSQNSRDHFISFRNDIADTYGYCFEVIKEKSLEIFLEYVQASVHTNYFLLESSLFGIKSLSDFLSSKHFPLLMEVIDLVIPEAEKAQIHQLSITCLTFLSEFSNSLNETNIRYLDLSLNFIFSSIKNRQISKNALLCLEKVCFSCQSRLLDAHFSWVFKSMIDASSVVEVLSIILIH